jgi:hypothetical protein
MHQVGREESGRDVDWMSASSPAWYEDAAKGRRGRILCRSVLNCARREEQAGGL